MRTLLDERFAPITSSIGFLELPLEAAASGLEEWRRTLRGNIRVAKPNEGFPEVLHRLEPLTGGAKPRELLVAMGPWTAYFDNALRGTDAWPVIGYLSRRLGCQGLVVVTVPHTAGTKGTKLGRSGALHFQMFGPLRTQFLNNVRTVAVTHDGDRWVFTLTGTQQVFEEPDAYNARQVRDRFTSDMLERYCQALGIDVFNPEAYGPDSVFLESPVSIPPQAVVMTLSQAQAWLEIDPETTQNLAG